MSWGNEIGYNSRDGVFYRGCDDCRVGRHGCGSYDGGACVDVGGGGGRKAGCRCRGMMKSGTINVMVFFILVVMIVVLVVMVVDLMMVVLVLMLEVAVVVKLVAVVVG